MRGEAGSLRGWGRGPGVKFKAWPGRFGADGDGAPGSLCSGQVLGPPGQRVFCGSAEGGPRGDRARRGLRGAWGAEG